ncbi:MAG: GTPase ObgE [SAR324 cluster bacterium]|nr:GTPase ObgE [SAR324 cluster bacterium]
MANFVDQAVIYCGSGKGGAGCASMRREKFIEFGGPNGGDGGKGGDVIFIGNPDVTTLQDVRLHKHQKAKPGQAGMGENKTGKQGEDKIIPMPLGTIVTNADTGEFLFEILDETPYVLLTGGRGGLGNTHFKTSRNQAPRYCQPGEPGEEMDVELELRVLADVGLVGFPNAGKSTLIATVSAARPKIADYPFTTLVPNLGVVPLPGFRTFVIADIPGLIENAHLGVGLGDQFLRHVQRTKVLAFLLDSTEFAEHTPEEAFKILMEVLEGFAPELAAKKRIILLSKTDAIHPDINIEEMIAEFKEKGEELYPISSATRKGMDKIMERLYQIVQEEAVAEKEKVIAEKRKVAADMKKAYAERQEAAAEAQRAYIERQKAAVEKLEAEAEKSESDEKPDSDE